MIISNVITMLFLFIAWMAFGICCDVLESSAEYIPWANGIFGGAAALFLLSLIYRLVRKGLGLKTEGIVRNTFAFAFMLGFLIAAEILMKDNALLKPYELYIIIGFAAFAVYYVMMLILTILNGAKGGAEIVRSIRDIRKQKQGGG